MDFDGEFDIEESITDQERSSAKSQVLSNLRSRYLQSKAEYIAMIAIGNTLKADMMKKQMEECDLSYKAVEQEM